MQHPIFKFADPVGDRLRREGRSDLVDGPPNWAYPWSDLYDRSSTIYRDGGPLQADRFADEASQIERLVMSPQAIQRTMRLASQIAGIGGPAIGESVVIDLLQQVYHEEVPYGDMMTPSFDRGVYGSGFLQRVADKIIERAASRVAKNVKADVDSQRMFHIDQQSHGLRGVFGIDRPQYAGARGGNDLSWESRMPSQHWE